MTTPVQVTRGPVDGVIEEIRVAMVRRRMTQRDLARKVGEADPWIHRRLTGKAEITVAELFRIAEALEVDPRSLLPGSSDNTRREHRHLWVPPLGRSALSAPRRPIRCRPLAA